MNWVQRVVDLHNELESPESFWRWAAISALSAVMKDNVWLDQQIFQLYPNIYTLFHADSGLKKGPPVNMAKKLVTMVNNTRVISGRGSIQGILKDLGTAYTQPGGKIANHKSVAFICSSELSSSIVEDKVATKILTDLYDRSYNVGEWRSLLKMETFTLKDPTITMLTATNEAMADDFFTRAAIKGGYFARTFIVYENAKSNVNTNSLIYPLEEPINYGSMVDYLKEVAKLSGPFCPLANSIKSDEYRYRKQKRGRKGMRDIWFNEPGVIFDDWYDRISEIKRMDDTKDETGTLNRFDASVLKVAMLLSLAEVPKLEISTSAMHEAIETCEKLLGNIRKTMMGKDGISSSAMLKTLIIMELLQRETHEVSRTALMKRLWQHYQDSEEFDAMMLAFDATGMIKTTSLGNQIIYYMPDEQVTELREFMKGKTGGKPC